MPRQLATVAQKLFWPVLLFFVSTLVDEFLILAIGYLQAIDVIRRHVVGTDPTNERDHICPRASTDPRHSLRSPHCGVQSELLPGRWSSDRFANTRFRDSPAEVAGWNQNAGEWRCAQAIPGAIRR